MWGHKQTKFTCFCLSSPSKVKKNLSSPSSQELVPLTLESVYGTLLTHSSLFSQSDRHRILHFEFRVVLNFSDMTSWFLNNSHTIDDFGMMPTAQEVTDTSIRRAAACSMTLHSVCMVVAAKNLKLYPIYRHGIGVERQEKSHNRWFRYDADGTWYQRHQHSTRRGL